jgi:predicted nucleic acid-binding protein
MATIKLKEFEIGFTDQFFFDTNVWLLLYGTVAGFQANDQTQYANLLEKLITRDSPIYITSMVISEFANVLLRRDFNQWISNNNFIDKDFKKDYVGTTEYKNSVATITVSINKIFKLPNLIVIADNFNAIDKNAILNNFKIVDFNDSYYAQLAILSKYKIVTNDKDFQKLDSNIDIITTKI